MFQAFAFKCNLYRYVTDETNPFTRQPLKVVDLVTDSELKVRGCTS
jgi:hypothetical protein